MAAAPRYRLTRLCGGLLVALLAGAALAPRAGEAQQAPDRSPVIVGVSVAGCVDYGDRLKLRGRNLGRAGGRQLVLRDPNATVALPVSSWNDMVITATVPRHRDLLRGRRYVLGIQELRTGKWLSGRGLTLQICEDEGRRLEAEAGKPPQPEPRPPAPHPRAEGPQAAAPAPPAPLPGQAAADADRVPDEVLAVTGSLADATALAQQLTAQGYAVRALQDLPALGFALLRLGLPGGQDVPAALDALRQAFPAVLFDANTLYEPDAAASSAGAPRHYAKALIGWPDAGPGCAARADIGLIDTAVDADHAALAGREIFAKIFTPAGVPPAPPDHGTAVAARLHAAAIFALRDDGRVVGTTDAIARAVDWLGQAGVRVVNLSLSGPGNQVMRLTVERAHAAGMILVAAAGNEGPHAAPVFPAGYAPVVAVTAVDAALQAYREANRGDYIDLAAPGVDVWSAGGGRGGRYNSGTSFAAPFVTAAAALALSLSPEAEPEAIRQSLRDGARDLGTPGRDSTFGWGLLQPPAGC